MIWLMRDNHTFRRIDDPETALDIVMDEYDTGPSLFLRGKMEPLHMGGRSRDEWRARAQRWLARAFELDAGSD